MEKKLNILHFPEWYPHKKDDMEGIFIQKHIKAIHTMHYCRVVYCKAHDQKAWISSQVSMENGIKVIRTFYKKAPTGISVIDKIIRKLLYIKSVKKSITLAREGGFKEDLLHLHVANRNRKFIKRFYSGPYVITEHWSKYLHQKSEDTNTKKFFNSSKGVSVVSQTLKKALQDLRITPANFKVIPNVVDEEIFKYKENGLHKGERKKILHVSEFNEEAKNIIGILEAVEQLAKQREDFELILVGYGKDKALIQEHIQEHRLSEFITMKNKVYPLELATMFQEADLFVLNSRYETFGVVIAEALLCGCPVVSTAVGVAPELIHESNGILVSNDLTSALDEALNKNFDRKAIAKEHHHKFGMVSVALQFSTWYKDALI